MIYLSVKSWFQKPAFLIAVAFMIWVFAFWGFLSGRISLGSDAISYYDHTKFFIDQLARGQFPLWDPYWGGGVPNDFFLRRIGPYNPFLLIPLILSKAGLKFFHAYMVFQAGYFFFGMTGFFLLARKLLKDNSAAFLSFLVLLFSALGTRMFDSYMLLVTIPVIWFFYFLVSFFIQPKRFYAAGLTLALMQLFTTYIPLYFLVIVLFFIVAFVFCCWSELPALCCKLNLFISRNKFFSLLCCAAIFLSVTPGLSFFGEAGKGGIAIPGRHYNTTVAHVLAVEPQQSNPWSIMEEFFFSSYYTDLTRIAFAIVYVPLFALIVLGAGILISLSRLFILLFLWTALIILFAMPIGFPLYDFLYAHVGFVKYFRNLHFLLWFILLPVFALLVGEVWKRTAEQFVEWPRWISRAMAAGVHAIALFLLMHQGDALLATFVALGASACVWWVVLSGQKKHKEWVPFLLLVAIAIQPLAVFQNLAKNYSFQKCSYFYDFTDHGFSHQTSLSGEGRVPSLADVSSRLSSAAPSSLYYTSGLYNALRSKVRANDLERYEHYKFYLYDQQPPDDDLSGAFTGEAVKTDSDRLRVVDFQVNKVILKADLDKRKFVVFNDVNYPGWFLRVNGKVQSLLTSNGAFKGFWLPAGKCTAVLTYGSFTKHFYNWMLILTFYGMFFYTAVLFWRGRNGKI